VGPIELAGVSEGVVDLAAVVLVGVLVVLQLDYLVLEVLRGLQTSIQALLNYPGLLHINSITPL